MTKEGELKSYVQETDDYDIDYYVDKCQQIVNRKLQIYQMLREKIVAFKTSLKEEEDMHRATMAKQKGGKGFYQPKENRQPSGLRSGVA